MDSFSTLIKMSLKVLENSKVLQNLGITFESRQYQLLVGARELVHARHESCRLTRKIICESILVCMSYLCLYNIFPMNNPLLYDHLYQNICIRVNDYFRPDVSPKFGQFDTIYFVANHDNSHLCGSNQCDLSWFKSVFNKIIKVILI